MQGIDQLYDLFYVTSGDAVYIAQFLSCYAACQIEV
jgi:hypothetical protein